MMYMYMPAHTETKPRPRRLGPGADVGGFAGSSRVRRRSEPPVSPLRHYSHLGRFPLRPIPTEAVWLKPVPLAAPAGEHRLALDEAAQRNAQA